MPRQRPTAYKARIDDVVTAEYVVQDAPEPNYLALYGEKVQRLQLIGLLVQKSSHAFVLDDGTNRVIAKRFNQSIDLDDVATGDPVLVLARPREHDDQIFLGAETVRPLNDEQWISVHHTFVDRLYDKETEDPVVDDQAEEEAKEVDGEDDDVNHSEAILNAITDLDDGDGAPTNDVIEAADVDDAESYIDMLINEGEIFEIRPGHLKVL